MGIACARARVRGLIKGFFYLREGRTTMGIYGGRASADDGGESTAVFSTLTSGEFVVVVVFAASFYNLT